MNGPIKIHANSNGLRVDTEIKPNFQVPEKVKIWAEQEATKIHISLIKNAVSLTEEKAQVGCLNKKGNWVPAIYEPYYHLIRKECECGKKFFTREGYEGHYALKHILEM